MTVEGEPKNVIEELLCDRGMFDIDSFGWSSADDVDQEFVGYAMWTLTPPYEHDFAGWQSATPPRRAPTKVEQQLMASGHDFFGLMKTARHFIGHALLHQAAVEPLRIEPTLFDFNEFAALVALNAAGDRLSDFVIVTALGKKSKEDGQRNKACDVLRDAGLKMGADALQEGFKSIAKARKARNDAVHRLATQPGRVQKQLIARDRQAFERQQWGTADWRSRSHEDVVRAMVESDARELAAVEARAQLMCDCYLRLVKMGGVVFRIEYDWRNRPKAPAGRV